METGKHTHEKQSKNTGKHPLWFVVPLCRWDNLTLVLRYSAGAQLPQICRWLQWATDLPCHQQRQRLLRSLVDKSKRAQTRKRTPEHVGTSRHGLSSKIQLQGESLLDAHDSAMPLSSMYWTSNFNCLFFSRNVIKKQVRANPTLTLTLGSASPTSLSGLNRCWIWKTKVGTC